MYIDFKYYQTEYGGEVFESEEAFQKYARKAERRVDTSTYGKLSFAFPAAEKDAAAVKDCICELAEFLYRVNQLQAAASDSVGVVKQEDGTVKGKVVTSVTSGSESRGYSAGGGIATVESDAAKDRKVFDMAVYSIIRDGLSGVPDANGVNLLYAGPYPVR
ncbi:hypothetical protein [Eisenbergiella porci]|jgi:hypothetical protein|uniref:hypothetical protein n=1 Tax=Eisenbergiella porci TaxID=2652274 RepID=UPI003AB77789